MILPFLAAAAALPLAQLPGGDAARFQACVALIKSDPASAVTQAETWTQASRAVPARHCLGLAYAATERWSIAAITFAQAAEEAQRQQDGRAAALWTQAGNAALAGEDPGQARDYLDRALALPTLPPAMKGEAWVDRARADVALNDLPLGRIDMDKGLQLVAQDPFAWLLSATLARRQQDLPRAAKDIAEAEKLAPDDPSVELEAGNIAAASGATAQARQLWQRVVTLGPGTAEAKAAAAALAGGE